MPGILQGRPEVHEPSTAYFVKNSGLLLLRDPRAELRFLALRLVFRGHAGAGFAELGFLLRGQRGWQLGAVMPAGKARLWPRAESLAAALLGTMLWVSDALATALRTARRRGTFGPA